MQMPKSRGYKYLFVMVDTCTGWVEAFPTWTEEVTKNLIKEIVPHFRISQSIQSDNGPGFTSKITLQVAKTLGINYSLHAAWRPQSWGKVEKMNDTLKQTTVGASLVAQRLKHLPAMQETWVWTLGKEDPLEKEMATHSSILAWRIPWTEEPGGPQSTGSQRVRYDWVT